MKAITLIISLLATVPAMAQPSHTVVQTKARMNLHDFECVKQIGQNDTYTKVTGDRSVLLGADPKIIELKHLSFTANGCDEPKLLEIQKRSLMGFGFLAVNLTVTKDVQASEGDMQHGCTADYIETVEADLGLGIKVSSVLVDTRPANDCRL